jgi:hypothetical protein
MIITPNTNSEISQSWLTNFRNYSNPRIYCLIEALELAKLGKLQEGSELLKEKMPFVRHGEKTKRYYSNWATPISTQTAQANKKNENEEVFKYDKFQCRFSGVKLISPIALNIISEVYHKDFPFPYFNAPYLISHIDVWTFYPWTVKIDAENDIDDKVHPSKSVTISSIVQSSFRRKLTNKELGISLIPLEELDKNWDGLLSKAIEFKNLRRDIYSKQKVLAKKYFEEEKDKYESGIYA